MKRIASLLSSRKVTTRRFHLSQQTIGDRPSEGQCLHLSEECSEDRGESSHHRYEGWDLTRVEGDNSGSVPQPQTRGGTQHP